MSRGKTKELKSVNEAYPDEIGVVKYASGEYDVFPHLANIPPSVKYIKEGAKRPRGCETCEGTGRIYCQPTEDGHTHPCTDCQPEAFKEFQRGYEAGKYYAENPEMDETTKNPTPAPQVDAWRGIDSAPRDGTQILIGGGNCPFVHVNRFHSPYPEFKNIKPYLANLGDKEQPTHWMPLPQPPQEE